MSMSRISHVVVHYSWTRTDQRVDAATIDRWHRQRGFRMIGYHLYIRADGTVEQGRPLDMVGAGVGGQNSGKWHVCYEGGQIPGDTRNGHDTRTPEQIAALIRVIGELLDKQPHAKVVGHRDLAATQCPGFDVPAWWASVEKGETVDPKPGDPDALPRTPDVGEDAEHVVERGDTLWRIAAEHGVTVQNLMAWNGLKDGQTIHPGDVLRVGPSRDAGDALAALISDIRDMLDRVEADMPGDRNKVDLAAKSAHAHLSNQ